MQQYDNGVRYDSIASSSQNSIIEQNASFIVEALRETQNRASDTGICNRVQERLNEDLFSTMKTIKFSARCFRLR
jgi:hypothetical protein